MCEALNLQFCGCVLSKSDPVPSPTQTYIHSHRQFGNSNPPFAHVFEPCEQDRESTESSEKIKSFCHHGRGVHVPAWFLHASGLLLALLASNAKQELYRADKIKYTQGYKLNFALGLNYHVVNFSQFPLCG